MSEVREWLAVLREGTQVTPKIGAVLDLIAKQPRLASYAAASTVAEAAHVNTATVVRAAQALGFEGWLALRAEVRSRYLASLTAAEVSAEHAERGVHPASSAVRQDVANLGLFSRSLDLGVIEHFATAIAQADRTAVVTTGSYAAVAAPLAHLGAVMGYPVAMETRGGTHLANVMSSMTPESCFVAISFWRLHAEIFKAARSAARRGATVCVITDSVSTPLAEVADHVIAVSSEGGSWFPSMTAGVCAVNAVLTSLERQGGQKVEDAIANAEHAWAELALYEI
ncbi:MurR/RpiR family transcriptional regulator [Nocardia testacea]|uniref:MurR/RpiR family transcriptional regulator n=1 Tax=Nocardia testacea TaxID=248551 RepID=UPI0002F53376|nr:SIS domain-containing protein [Nocardia testacea]